MAVRALQRQGLALFQAPILYTNLSIADGRLTLTDLEVSSPAGYTLTAKTVSLPFDISLSGIVVATPTAWIIDAGEISWNDDDGCSSCRVHCDPVRKTLSFEQREQCGRVQWESGQWVLDDVPLASLVRVASLLDVRWSEWGVDSGNCTGTWDGTAGHFHIAHPSVHHRHYPISGRADQGLLVITDGSHITFDAPLTLTIGQVVIDLTSWMLHVVDRETIRWVWDCPTGQPGRLSMTIHPQDGQVELDGIYQSEDQKESLTFQVTVPPDGPVNGKVKARSLSLKPTLSPLVNRLLEGHWSGTVDVDGELEGNRLTATILPHDLTVETAHAWIAFATLSSPLTMTLDPDAHQLHAHFRTEHSSFLDKNTGLLLSELAATIDVSENEWGLSDLEAYYHHLRFSGSGNYVKTHGQGSKLALHVDAVTGRLSQLQEMLVFLNPKGFVQVIPLDGDVQLDAEGGDLSLITRGPHREIAVNASGALIDGNWRWDDGNLSMRNVEVQFTYAYPANRLELRDLQGTVLVGRPGESLEQYQCVGDHLTFSDYGKQQMQFDIWIGDRRRDVLRLVGSTEPRNDGALNVRFDKGLTHLGSVHPDRLELSLLNWTCVNHFRLAINFRADQFLHDLQRLDRTGLISIDDKISKALQSLESAQGLCRFDCGYDRKTTVFDYHLHSDGLSLNDHLLNGFQLKGTIQHNAWLIDPLRWDDLAFSAEMVKLPDRWRIDFLGIRIGKCVLAGLEGDYLIQPGRIDARVNLFDVDLGHLSQLPLEGKWKSQGTLTIDVTQFPRSYPLHAILEGSLNDLSIDGMHWDDMTHVPCEIVAVDRAPTLKMAIHNPTNPSWEPHVQVGQATWSADPQHMRLEAQLTYCHQPIWVLFNTDWRGESGQDTIRVSDTYPFPHDALTVSLKKTANRRYETCQVQGKLFGITTDLRRHLPRAVAETGIGLVGSVTLDLQKMGRFLPPDLSAWIHQWKLGDGYSLKGYWFFPGVLATHLHFTGELLGENCAVAGRTIHSLHAAVEISPQEVHLNALTVTDPDLQGKAQTLTLHRLEDGRWTFDCCKVECLAVDLSRFAGNLHGWTLPMFAVDSLAGYLDDPNSIQGTGSLRFSRSSACLDITLPGTGMVDWKIADRKIILKALKDVYGEGKLLKFSLLKDNSIATLDFDGQLDMRIRIKPTRPLLKLADKSILSIRGSIKDPIIALQQDAP